MNKEDVYNNNNSFYSKLIRQAAKSTAIRRKNDLRKVSLPRSRPECGPRRRLCSATWHPLRRQKRHRRLAITRDSHGAREASNQSRSGSIFNLITLIKMIPLLFLICFLPSAQAMRATGVTQLSSSLSPVFLSNFAVGPDGARFDWSAEAGKPTTIGLYDLQTWNQIQYNEDPGSCGCECYAGRLLPGTSFSFEGGSASNGTNFAFPMSTPGYVIIAALSCGDDITDTVSWTVHLTLSSGLFPEIPWNSQGLLECYGISVTLSSLLLVSLVITHEWWKGKRWYLSPPPTKLYMLSVVTWVAGSACILTHLVIYSKNGVGSLVIEGFGRVVQVIGRLIFITTLLMMARGYAIHFSKLPPVCAPIKQVSKARSTEGACIAYTVILALSTCYLILGISYVVDRSPDNTTYVYDSVTGLVECGTQAFAGIWFILEVWRTYEKEYRELHRDWLFNFGALNVLFFLTLPVMVLVAMFEFESYEDEKIVEITMQASTAFFYVSLLLTTMLPQKADLVFSRWEPDVNVVKLMRPEIGSVDLLTPVLSGYSTPSLSSSSFRGNSNGKGKGISTSRRPGYGTVSSSGVEDGISMSAVPQRRLKPTAASAQGRSKLSKLKASSTFNKEVDLHTNTGNTSPKEVSIIQISESHPSMALPMLLGASSQKQSLYDKSSEERGRSGRTLSRGDQADVPLLMVSQDIEASKPQYGDTNVEVDEEENTPDVPVNTTDLLRDVLQNSFLSPPSEPGSRSRQGSVRYSFGRKESFSRKDSFGGRRLSSLKSDRPRLASVLDGLDEERESGAAATDR
jgi:hypothetical protein